MKIWKACVILVALNRPPNIPIPLPREVKYVPDNPINEENNNTSIEALLKSIDLSRLEVTALDNNLNIKE